MRDLYLVTGANGHLGSAVCATLKENNYRVKGLVLPDEDVSFLKGIGVEVCFGNVCDTESFNDFFNDSEDCVFIHCAGIVDITGKPSKIMDSVNVQGTKNAVALAKKHKVGRFIYVSSVHALPELQLGRVMSEIPRFDSNAVESAYAKTKATVGNIVLEAVKDGLPAIIVHPSGIIGPYLGQGNHLVQLVKNYLDGKLPACVRGGYDFVDVRDVALGILSAAKNGRIGECYILSGGYYEIPEVLGMLRKITNGKKVGVVPTWLARAFAPIMERSALRRKRKPLFTAYSLFTLTANGRFSHDKATVELGYLPRELYETLKDTVRWLYANGDCRVRIKRKACRRKREYV